jgi:hypothetical protein
MEPGIVPGPLTDWTVAKKRLELGKDLEKPADFDIVLHGSAEHLDAVRALHAHHEQQHNQLKEENSSLFEKFEHVRDELDVLNSELHMLTGMPPTMDRAAIRC